MSDSKYQNFDYDLSQKILTLLKVSLACHFESKKNFFSREKLNWKSNKKRKQDFWTFEVFGLR